MAHADSNPSANSVLGPGSKLCPKLFGTAKSRAANRAFREKNLHWLRQDKTSITVAHSHADWERVAKLQVKGVQLVGQTSQKEQSAVIQISSELASRIGCPAGNYQVQRDDSIGRSIRVQHILHNVLLVTQKKRIGFLSVTGTPDPNWLLAWKIRGLSIPIAYGSSSSSNSRSSKRSTPRPAASPRKAKAKAPARRSSSKPSKRR